MKYAVSMFPTEYAIRIDDLARAAEERGFESLWVPEHTHIPTSRRTPFPGGAELPKEYSHTIDPFVGLAAAAAVTTKLKLGTAICLVVERDPIVLAKEVASLDLLSNGRFLFGVGVGWNREEMEDHGTDPKTRRTLMKERIEAMKAIWTQDEAEYHGRFVNFDKIWSYPKPVQKPHPPILMGGQGSKALRGVIEYCDGWMPIPARIENLVAQVSDLRRQAEQAGRDPKSISITIFWGRPDKAAIEQYEKAGAERVIFLLPPAPRDTVMPKVDECAKLIGN
ncbi:MAG TPA: LLM class F420-dependent oxidoreductase [Candidatus Binataceae bacterium]|jgi:probable F420-dependent oxidoreductase|nr:LLM class F420-dependent oxidoreductase [Candidatus Binataceae bacterium]